MILFEYEEKKFAKEFIEEIKNKIGKGKPVKIPDEYIKTYHMSEGPPRKVAPKGKWIQFTTTVSMEIKENNKGEIISAWFSNSAQSRNVTITYCTKKSRMKNDGPLNTSPSHFKETRTLYQKDYEIYWFLLHSILMKGSLVEKMNTQNKFHMELYDPEAHFTKKITNERLKDKVNMLIKYGPEDGGVTEQKLEEMADAMFIPRGSWDGINHLRSILIERIDADEKAGGLSGTDVRGYKYALDLLKGDDVNAEIKIQIQRAADGKVIMKTEKPKMWFYCDKHSGQATHKICDIAPTATNDETALLAFLKANAREYEHFKEMCKASNVNMNVAINNKENLIRMIDAAKSEERWEDVVQLCDNLIAITNAVAHRTWRKEAVLKLEALEKELGGPPIVENPEEVK